LCDRLAVLDFGELIALGVPEVVQADHEQVCQLPVGIVAV